MKKWFYLLLLLSSGTNVFANYFETTSIGDWSDPSNWRYWNGAAYLNIASVPTTFNDDVHIGHQITVNTNPIIGSGSKLECHLNGKLVFENNHYIAAYPNCHLSFSVLNIRVSQAGGLLNFADNLPTTYSTGCFYGFHRDSISLPSNPAYIDVAYYDNANVLLSDIIPTYGSLNLKNSNLNYNPSNSIDINRLSLNSSTLNWTQGVLDTIHLFSESTFSISGNNLHLQRMYATDASTITISGSNFNGVYIGMNLSSTLTIEEDVYLQQMDITSSTVNINHTNNLNFYEDWEFTNADLNINAATTFESTVNLNMSEESNLNINAATVFANIPILSGMNSSAMVQVYIDAPVTFQSSGVDDTLCTYTTGVNAELHYVSNLADVNVLNVATLKKLEVNIAQGEYLYLQDDLKITANQGLMLIKGDLNTNSHKLILENDSPVFHNALSTVCGTISIKVETFSNAHFEYINFPIGVAHIPMPIRVNLSTNGAAACYLTASVYNTIPMGTPDSLTIGGAMSNRYYKLKVEQTNLLYNTNTIAQVANIELEPTGVSPLLYSKSMIGFSVDNSTSSYQGIESSVSSPYISSTQLSSTQIADLGSADGSYIGIAKRTMASGHYCIGPSSIYTAPVGSPSYVNATNPFGNLSLALNELQSAGSDGPVTFVLQNNYSGVGGAPFFELENNPISISYQGDAIRTLTITTRTDNTVPVLIENTKTNGIGIIEFNGARYVTINGRVNNTCGEYGIRLHNNASYSLNFAPGYSNCMSFKNDAKHITISGIQFEVADRGINVDNNTAIQGSDSITISCNRFMVRSNLFNINCHPYGIVFGHNGFANPTSLSNDITIQYNKFENMETGIYLSVGISGKMTISNNHFYRNINNSPGPGFQHFIYNGKPANFIIDQNYFGGSEPYCGGAKMNTGNAQYLLLLGAGTPSSNVKSVMSNNRFENMTMGNTLYGVQVAGSCVWDIIGNRFGNPNVSNDLSSSSSITFHGIYNVTTSNATTNALISTIEDNSFNNIQCNSATGDIFYGIYFNGPASSIKNNSFKNILHAGTHAFQMIYAASYTPMVGQTNEFSYNTAENIIQANTTTMNDNIGIFKVVSGAGLPITLNCVGNRIGSLTNNNDILFNGSLIRTFSIDIWQHATHVDSNTICNVTLTNEATSPHIMLNVQSQVIGNCAYNTIFNIDSKSKYNSPESGTPQASLSGIILNCNDGYLSTNSLVHHNKIYNLTNSNTTTQTYGIGVAGLIIKGNSQNISSYTIYNNEVSRLTNQAMSSGTNPYVFGIAYSAGTKSIWYNNTIHLNGIYTNAINNYCVRKFYGTQGFKFYHNTLVLEGNSVTNGNGYCLYKEFSANNDTMKNNIYRCLVYPSGSYYCLGTNSLAPHEWGISDYNAFYNLYGNQLGYKPVAAMNFSTWKSFFNGTETHSLYHDFLFQDVLAEDLHLNPNTNCALNNAGISIPIVTTDMDGDTRNNPPDIGADEFTYIEPIVTATATNPTTCEGANLDVSSASSSPLTSLNYSWTGPNSYTSSTQNNSISNAQAINQGTYSVTVTDFYGCSSSGTVSVTVAPTVSWYYDEDGDGYSVGTTVTDCVSPGAHYSFTSLGVDCDDVNATIHPGATEICGNSIDDNCDGNIDEGCNTVNILAGKLWLQGYYIGGEQMNPVLSYQGVAAPTSIADSIYLELRDENSPTVIAYSTMTTLGVDGEFAAIDIPSNLLGQSYYLVVRHRNSIETWSANAIQLTSNTYHNFTTAANKAYGENQIEIETGKWAFYTGDINQDGFVDSFDFPALDTDIFNGVSSVYVNTDLNGDGFVDSFDFPVFDANSYNGVSMMMP